MILMEVADKATERDFMLMPLKIYKNYPEWIRPLDKDIRRVFDPKKNRAFEHGECIRWVLYDDQHQAVGRIAAFINHLTVNDTFNEQPTGGVGFFECVNDQECANSLFDISKKWLRERGMEAMDGPINFGERESWWGLLIEGFHAPQYQMNYNPPYYRALFEHYGFKTYFEQRCYSMPVDIKRVPEKYYQRHDMVAKDPAYKAVHLHKNQLHKFAEDFTTIFNKAWVVHGEGRHTTTAYVYDMFKEMKPIVQERTAWFVYHNDEPIAFWLSLPDINQIMKKFNGRFGIWEKIRLLWYIKTNYCTRLTGIIFGIIPEYRAKGVDAFLIVEASEVMKELNYTEYEMQWESDFNPKMENIVRRFNTVLSRKLITYRKLFDETKEFKRMPILKY